MDGHYTSAESQTLAITTSPSTPYSLIPATSAITITVTLIHTNIVPGPTRLVSMGDTEPTRESHLTAAAIIGGTVVAAMLLALLLNFVVVRFYRRKQKFAITPFNLPSTAELSPVEPPQVWIEFQSTSNFGIGVRPASNSRRPSTVQLEHPDPCLVQDGVPSGVRVDPIPSPLLPLPNDTNDNKNDASTSTDAKRQRSHELSELYPSPSPILAQHHRHIGLGLSVDSWVELEVMGASDHHHDCSREPSEELPAYT